MKKISLLFAIIFSIFSSYSQRAKNGAYTVTATNTIVNSYTSVTANASIGQTAISVTSNVLTNSVLPTALAQGDLILIIQMQGATMDVNTTPTVSWGSSYTVPNTYISGTFGVNGWEWGQVTNYNQAGMFEYAQVASVSGSTTINLTCGLKNNYVTSGHIQVVRVPRFSNLTVNSTASITANSWDGTTGGIVAIEVDQVLNLQANALITVTGKGFRGGAQNDNTTNGSNSASDPLQIGFLGSSSNYEGAAKGEGIGGYNTEYDLLYSRYCKGAPANGGGAGDNHNAGGGGGSNVGVGAYTGIGVPNSTYNSFWNLEMVPIGGQSSAGGGRGGYTYSTSNQDESVVGPNNNLWSGDKRRNDGGFGGHPLQNDNNRLFMGGGGGAGDQNFSTSPNQVGVGGAGGGIILLDVYGSITGTGSIEANGANGGSSNPTNNTTPTATQKFGNDGAGGAGGGGAIRISNNGSIPATISLKANGGVGGNQAFYAGNLAPAPAMEADGPGGGGAGGLVTYTLGAPIVQVAGGANGVTNSAHVTSFPPNGATSGNSGLTTTGVNFYDLIVQNDTICGNGAATLSVSVLGTLPSGTSVNWYTNQFSGNSVHTGLTFTTPSLSTSTTYYVGICPGDFRKPVQVVIGSNPVISGTPTINNVTCTGNNGSISGLVVNSGTPNYSYSWNGNLTPSINLSNANAGNYTLTVSDANGCSATSGPYTIGSSGGPTINTSNVSITNSICTSNTGSISGITQTGGVTFSWSNSGGNSLNASNLAPGTYSLTVTDVNGCSASAGPYTITAPSGPDVDATNSVITNATCGIANGSITGISTTGNGLTYLWSNSAGTSIDATALNAGSYSLTVTDNQGCVTTTGPFSITQSATPTLNVNGVILTPETCDATNGAITGIQINGGTNPLTYSWSNTSQTTLAISNLNSGTYTLTVTDGNGCTAISNPFSIVATPMPTINNINVLVSNESCTGGDGSITGLVVTGSSLSYAWNGNVGSLNLTNASAGTYTLVVTDGNNCSVSSGPYTINGSTPLSIDMTNSVITASACTSATGTISGIAIVGGINPTFTWSNNATTLNQTGLTAGSYLLSVIDDQGCSANQNVMIVSANGPDLDSSAVVILQPTCGLANGSITGLVNNSLNATILWNNQVSTIDNSNLEAGTYELIATGADGCVSSFGPVVLNVSSAPNANFSYSPTEINPGEVVNFTDLSTSDVTDWNWGIDTALVSTQNPEYSFGNEGIYPVVLYVTNAAGCSDSIILYVTVLNQLVIPNVLTRNNDGINDVFEIAGLEKNTTVEIVNRWGTIVFSSADYLNDWKGLDASGNKLVDGVYTYYVKTPKGEMKQGFIHLLN